MSFGPIVETTLYKYFARLYLSTLTLTLHLSSSLLINRDTARQRTYEPMPILHTIVGNLEAEPFKETIYSDTTWSHKKVWHTRCETMIQWIARKL